MPDLKTALQEALSKTANAWAADDEAHQKIDPQKQENAMTVAATTVINDGRIVNNISRTVFNFIHGNPGIKRQDARDRLVAQGFKDTSVTSLISQMLRTGMVRMDGENLFVLRQEYAPIPSVKAKNRKVVKIVRKPRTEPVVELEEETMPETRPYIATPLPTLPNLSSAESVLKNMSVQEAFRLYQELSKMFGGK